MKKQIIVVAAVVALLGLFGAATVLVRQQKAAERSFLASENAHVFVPEGAITYGPAEARVIITEWFDPACETCAQLYRPVKDLVAAHPGQVRLVVRHAPFHEGSDMVVKMLLGARAQGRYWEAVELAFATQAQWTRGHVAQPALFWELLPRAGVDLGAMETAIADPAFDQEIARDVADAKAVGVQATPEYYVNGKPLPTWGYEQLVTLVEQELALQYP